MNTSNSETRQQFLELVRYRVEQCSSPSARLMTEALDLAVSVRIGSPMTVCQKTVSGGKGMSIGAFLTPKEHPMTGSGNNFCARAHLFTNLGQTWKMLKTTLETFIETEPVSEVFVSCQSLWDDPDDWYECDYACEFRKLNFDERQLLFSHRLSNAIIRQSGFLVREKVQPCPPTPEPPKKYIQKVAHMYGIKYDQAKKRLQQAYTRLNSFKAIDETDQLQQVRWILDLCRIQHDLSQIPTKAEFKKLLMQETTRPQANFMSVFANWIITSKLGFSIDTATQFAERLLTLITCSVALTEVSSHTSKALLITTLAVNLGMTIYTIFKQCGIAWNIQDYIDQIGEKVVRNVFFEEFEDVDNLDFDTPQNDIDWTSVSEQTTQGYFKLKAEFNSAGTDTVSVVVSMLSWVLSSAAVIACGMFDKNIKDLTQYVSFFNQSRTLQMNLRRDLGGLEGMIRNYLQGPDEAMLKLYTNRLAAAERLLARQDIDIATEAVTYAEWREVLDTMKRFLAMPMKNDGLKSIRTTMSKVYTMMIDRAKDIDLLNQACGIRVDPLGLYLFSTFGGIGKSGVTVRHLVPHINNINGAPDGTQVHLKMSEANHYFPRISGKCATFVVDEFGSQRAHDPFIPYINGVHSNTPLPLDGAYDKAQYCTAKAVIYLANVPGFNLTAEPACLSREASEALWGRLKQFFVVNLSRPSDLSPKIRDFNRESDCSDLIFLPGFYEIPRADKKGTSPPQTNLFTNFEFTSLPPDMQATIKSQLDGRADWKFQPRMVNGELKQIWTLQDLKDYITEETAKRIHDYEVEQQRRRQQYISAQTNAAAVQINPIPDGLVWVDTGAIDVSREPYSQALGALTNQNSNIFRNQAEHFYYKVMRELQEITTKAGFGYCSELWQLMSMATISGYNIVSGTNCIQTGSRKYVKVEGDRFYLGEIVQSQRAFDNAVDKHYPVRLIQPQTANPRFVVNLWGPPGSGKSYLAASVAQTIADLVDFDIIQMDRRFLDLLDVKADYMRKPNIFLADDTVWHSNYLTLYDNCHPKSIIIITTNRVPHRVSIKQALVGVFSEGSWYSTAARLFSLWGQWPRTIDMTDQTGNQLEEGAIRRLGLEGAVQAGSFIADVDSRSALEFYSFHRQFYSIRHGLQEKYNGNETFRIIWDQYNKFLEAINEVSYVDSPSLEATKRILGGAYRDPDVEIEAEDLKQLIWLLSSPKTIVSRLSKSTNDLPRVRISSDLINPDLGVRSAEPFVINLPENPAWNDVLEEGLVLYNKICKNANEPSVLIKVQGHTIYCYRRKIYTSIRGTGIEHESGWVDDNYFVIEGGRREEVESAIVWYIITGQKELVPTQIPAWVLQIIKRNKTTLYEDPKLLKYRIAVEKSQAALDLYKFWSTTFAEKLDLLIQSPFWKVFQISFALISGVGIIVWIWRMLTAGSKSERLKEDEPFTGNLWAMAYLATLIKQEKEEEEYELFDISLESAREAQMTDEEYQRWTREREKVRNKNAKNKRFRMRGGRNLPSKQHPVPGTKQNVRGMIAPFYHEGDSQREVIISKIRENIVHVHVSDEARDFGCTLSSGFGLALADDKILIPAHYYTQSMEARLNPKTGSPCYCPFTIRCIQKKSIQGVVMEVEVEMQARVYSIDRSVELCILQVPVRYDGKPQQFNRFPSIMQYIPTVEELIEMRSAELHVPKEYDVYRMPCNISHHVGYDSSSGLKTLQIGDDINMNRHLRVSWLNSTLHTVPGMCGTPYIGYAKNAHLLCGIHVAAGAMWAFGAHIDQDVIQHLLTPVSKRQQQIMPSTPRRAMYSYLEHTDKEIQDWMLNVEERLGYPLIVWEEWLPILGDISSTYYISEKSKNSPLVLPLGYSSDLAQHSPMKLRREQTPWSESMQAIFGPPPKIPSTVSSYKAHPSQLTTVTNQLGQSKQSLLWHQFDLCTETPPSVDWKYIHHAISIMFPRYKMYYCEGTHSICNDFEILNGKQFGPYKGVVAGMELDAAAGRFISQTFGVNLKKDFIDITPDGVKMWKQNSQTQKFTEYLRYYADSFEEGFLPLTVFSASAKAELVKPTVHPDGTISGKSRLFAAGSMDLQYVCMRWFGTFAGSVKRHYSHMPTQVGVDPCHTLWHLYNRASEITDQTICIDFKRWDKLYSKEHMLIVSDFIIELILTNFKIPYNPDLGRLYTLDEVRQIMKRVFRLNFAAFMSVDGVLLYVDTSNFSGSFWTAILNSFGVESLVIGAILRSIEYEAMDKSIAFARSFRTNIWEWCVIGTLGDDCFIAPGEELLQFGLNYSMLSRHLRAISGYNVTPASKDENILETSPLEGSEFISRRGYREGLYWRFPLKPESVKHLFYWQTCHSDQEEVNIQTLDFMIREAALHGEKFFQEVRDMAKYAGTFAKMIGWYKYYEFEQNLQSFEEYMDYHREEIASKLPLPPLFQLGAGQGIDSFCRNHPKALCGPQTKDTEHTERLATASDSEFSSAKGVRPESYQVIESPIQTLDLEQQNSCTVVTRDNLTEALRDAYLHRMTLPNVVVKPPFRDALRALLYTHLEFLCRFLSGHPKISGLPCYVSEWTWQYLTHDSRVWFSTVDGYRVIKDDMFTYALSIVLQNNGFTHRGFKKMMKEVWDKLQPQFPSYRYYEAKVGEHFEFYICKNDDEDPQVFQAETKARLRALAPDLTELQKTVDSIPARPIGTAQNNPHHLGNIKKLTPIEAQQKSVVKQTKLAPPPTGLGKITKLFKKDFPEDHFTKLEQEESTKEAQIQRYQFMASQFPSLVYGKSQLVTDYFSEFSEIEGDREFFKWVCDMFLDYAQRNMKSQKLRIIKHHFKLLQEGRYRSPVKIEGKAQNDSVVNLFPRARTQFTDASPTPDQNAPQAVPSGVMPLLNTHSEEAATRLTFPCAPDGAYFGGAMNSVWQIAQDNWMSVNEGGGPVISVPVGTEIGKVLFQGNYTVGLNDFHKVLLLMHKRAYPSIQFKINFIGTGTWAGNVLVGITPEKPPTGSTQETDNYIRMFLWDQFTLSDVGAVEVELNRIVNNAQSNPYWNEVGAATDTGPYLTIMLATGYEQALANENTAWQVQILSRFGKSINMYYPDVKNIAMMIKSVESVKDQVPGGTVKQPLSALAGLTLDAALRSVLGQGTTYYPRLVINGSTFRIAQNDGTFVNTGADLLGYSMITNSEYRETVCTTFDGSQTPKGTTMKVGVGTVQNSAPYTACFLINSLGFSATLLADFNTYLRSHSSKGIGNSIETYGLVTGDPSVEQFLSFLSSTGYDVTFSAVTYSCTFSDTEWPTRYARVSRNGITDGFWCCIGAPTKGGSKPTYINTPSGVTDIVEVPDLELQGSTMPTGYRRFELAYPNAVNSSTNIPVAEFRVNAAWRAFLRANCPSEYQVRIDLTSSIINTRIISVYWNPNMDTTFVNMPDTNLNHAVFTGAAVNDLIISNISLVAIGGRIASTDSSSWTSLQVSTALAGEALNTGLQRSQRVWNKKPVLTPSQQEAVRYEVSRILGSQGSSRILATEEVSGSGSAQVSHQGSYARIRGFQKTSAQDLISPEKKQLALALATGGLGAAAGAAKAAKAANSTGSAAQSYGTAMKAREGMRNAAASSKSQSAKNGATRGREMPYDATSEGIMRDFVRSADKAREAQMQERFQDARRVMSEQQARNRPMIDLNSEHDPHARARHFWSTETHSETVNQGLNVLRGNRYRLNHASQNIGSRERSDAGHGLTPSVEGLWEQLQQFPSNNTQNMQNSNKQAPRNLKTMTFRNSLFQGRRRQLGTANFRSIGISQGLLGNAQQHQYDKKMFELNAMLERELAGMQNQHEIDMMMKQAGIDREAEEFKQAFAKWQQEEGQNFQKELSEQEAQQRLKELSEQYGFDKELQAAQQEHQKEIQESGQEHEKELQDSAHQNTLEQQQQQADLAAQAQRQQLISGGALTAGLAGLRAGQPAPSTMTSTLSPTVSSRA